MILQSLLPVFILIALGWALRRFEVVSKENWRGIEQLAFWVLFPALLFHSLVRADLDSLSINSLLLVIVSAMAVTIPILVAIYIWRARIFDMNGPGYSSVFQAVTRWNAFVALAIMDKLGGAEGLAIISIIMAITIPTLNIINILVVAYTASDSGPNWRTAFSAAGRNPIIWGALAGLGFNLSGVPIYEPVLVSLEIIARAGLGIGLLTVGAAVQVRSMLKPKPEMLIGLTGKMLVFPALVIFFCALFDVSGLTRVAVVLFAAVPTAMNGYVIAKEMGGDAELYASIAASQTLLSVFSIPLFLYFVAG